MKRENMFIFWNFSWASSHFTDLLSLLFSVALHPSTPRPHLRSLSFSDPLDACPSPYSPTKCQYQILSLHHIPVSSCPFQTPRVGQSRAQTVLWRPLDPWAPDVYLLRSHQVSEAEQHPTDIYSVQAHLSIFCSWQRGTHLTCLLIHKRSSLMLFLYLYSGHPDQGRFFQIVQLPVGPQRKLDKPPETPCHNWRRVKLGCTPGEQVWHSSQSISSLGTHLARHNSLDTHLQFSDPTWGWGSNSGLHKGVTIREQCGVSIGEFLFPVPDNNKYQVIWRQTMSQTAQVTAVPEGMGTANAFSLMGWSHELGKGKEVGGQVLSLLLMLPLSHHLPWMETLSPGRSSFTDLPHLPFPSLSPGSRTAVESATRCFHPGWQSHTLYPV